MDNLINWQKKYDEAKNKYADSISEYKDDQEADTGKRKIKSPDGSDAKKQGPISRKICFEMVESQIDTTVSMPKVVSRKGREDRGRIVESILKTEINDLNIGEILDEQARLCPTTGSAIFFLEWDNSYVSPFGVGRLRLKNLSPEQVIPQPGVYELDEMDYIFLTFEQSKDYIKRTYGVDVESEGDNGENPLPDLRTHVFCYYKNDNNGIGLISWVGNTIVQDYEDYFARKQEVCTKCGAVRQEGSDTCDKCGAHKFKKENKEYEEMLIPTKKIDPQRMQPVMIDEKIKVKYYVPNVYPIVIRKNVAVHNKFLGGSDVEAIKDHQNDSNILMNKIRQKVLKGGSYMTVPAGKKIEANDDELKIVEIDSPADKALFDIVTVQPNIATDVTLLEQDYQIARQTVGITDSYQGRQDKSATSGKAKEVAVAQTAGRLESKQVMKDNAFARLYKLMFMFLLAYTDEQIPYFQENSNGSTDYKWFDKKFFIDQDANGNFYYDDQFVFTIDVSATLENDRNAMWKETRSNFESGAYGDPKDINTLEMYWTAMNKLHYPCAPDALKSIEQRKQQQQQQAMEQLKQQMLINSYANNKVNSLVRQNYDLASKQNQNQKKKKKGDENNE